MFSHAKVAAENDNFIWIVINPNEKENAEWVKKYRYKTMPTVVFCLFNGKYTTKITGVCRPTDMLSKLKKLKRKNKSAWKKEKKKRDKKKKEEEEAKEKEDKKDEDKKDEDKKDE